MQRVQHPLAVSAEKLRARCDANSFSFETTAALPTPPRMVGQDRAAEALSFGMGVADSRYNMYVAGPAGSGRSVAALDEAQRVAAARPVPDDWCYVFNFADPYAPRALTLPAGTAREFAAAISDLLEHARHTLRDAFESDAYRTKRDEVVRELEGKRDELRRQFETQVAEQGFAIQAGEGEPNFIPLKPATEPDGKPSPYTQEEYDALSAAEQDRIKVGYSFVESLFISVELVARRLGLQAREALRQLDRAAARMAVDQLFNDLRTRYHNLPKVLDYLTHMQDDMTAHARNLMQDAEPEPDLPPSDEETPPPARARRALLTRYKVNVLVDRAGQTGAPIVHEHNPTYYNVTGRLEYGANLYTDHMNIKPGVLHQANGGYFIVHALDIVTNQKAWEGLKRALRTGMITVENLIEQQQPALANSLKPEPIPLAVKVVLIGDYDVWGELYKIDRDFHELFKVRVDFDDEMPRNPQTEVFYAMYAGEVARMMGLPPLDRAAVARVIEEGSRMAQNQTKLTAALSGVRDLVVEAAFWAKSLQSGAILAAHVDQAIKTRRKRTGIDPERYSEAIRQGRIMISTTGATVGQINGLSILVEPGMLIGIPARITARVAPGNQGVLAIEREVELSGALHSKGVLILQGYLAGQFGQEQPLSLTGSLTFEQSGSLHEGDSASMAELCALLSALANVPIRQNLAMTGSVNQFGESQAIGGVNEKIEGFFDICQSKGLTNDQGVIIPEANVRNLMLRLDVVEAVREGAFHIYAIRTVEDAVELLMGRPAGRRQPDGEYIQGTINALVTDRLRAFAERVRYYRQQE